METGAENADKLVEEILGKDINTFICDDPGLVDPTYSVNEEIEDYGEEYNIHCWASQCSPQITQLECKNINPAVEEDIRLLGYSSGDLPNTGLHKRNKNSWRMTSK